MTVKTILTHKGRNIVTVRLQTMVGEVVTCLAENRIGAVVVVDDARKIAGIISERDVVRVLAEHGAAALDMPVGDVMTRAVVTCTPDETIAAIMERMTLGRFRHVPVLTDGDLTGIVSIGDVVKHRVAEMEREQDALRSYIMTA